MTAARDVTVYLIHGPLAHDADFEAKQISFLDVHKSCSWKAAVILSSLEN
jgi:hypothetical protein